MKECEWRIPVEGDKKAASIEGERRDSIGRASEPEMNFVGKVIVQDSAVTRLLRQSH